MKRGLLVVLLLGAACAAPDDGASTDVILGAMPPPTCPAGTRPAVGKEACEPVGVTSCGEGFTRADDGWGCEAVTAAKGCTGVRRAKLGDRACIADDDCTAAFPPAGAFAVVRGDAELTAALADVPAGGTIALDTGVYSAIAIERDVSLVGRCAEKVRVRGTGQRGIYVVGEVKASVRSLSVEGFDGGIVAAYGPELEVSNVVLSGNKIGVVAGEATVRVDRSVIEGPPLTAEDAEPLGAGASAQLGAKLTLSEVEIRDTSPAITAYEDDTELTLRRSVTHYSGPAQTSKTIIAYGGAKVVVEQSALRMRAGALMSVGNSLPGTNVSATKARGATVRVSGSELRQTGFVRDKPWAIASKGGRIELDETSVLHESVFAFMVGDAGTAFHSRGSVIRSGPIDGFFRGALFVTAGASAELVDTAVAFSIQSALTVGHPGSQLTLTRSLVTGTVFRGPGPSAEEGGAGIAVGVGKEATLVLKDSAVVDSEQFGLMADGLGRVEIESGFFDATRASPTDGGGDAVVVSGGAQLAMSASVVRGSEDAAIMAVGGEGIVDASRFVGNKIGIHLTGTRLREATERPLAAELEELVLVNAIFAETGESRVRTAPIVLPGTPVTR